MMGNPLMNDAQLSQTAGRTKTRQPGLLAKPTQIVLKSYRPFLFSRNNPHSTQWERPLDAFDEDFLQTPA
jgi:hypothetical protein